jgi:SAM-dependent methyltransferase
VTSVIWHDVECGSYTADLPLWRELAGMRPGPILDVGAGTGRVALALGRDGHEVVALDRDGELLAALAERAAAEGLDVASVEADAAGFELEGAAFGLILVPMQTIQLLDGLSARRGFLDAARRHLRPDGLLAIVIAEELEAFEEDSGALPLPDVAEHDGSFYLSHPVAVREVGGAVRMERIRQVIAPDGSLSAEGDTIELARIGADELEVEGRAAGLHPRERRYVDATPAHVGSTVVILGG